MKAIAITPRVVRSGRVVDVPEPEVGPGLVRVRAICAGICGTDAELYRGEIGSAPVGADYLVIGHENFGVVEVLGDGVEGFAVGDHVVATVRRPGGCANCLASESDMCADGVFTERGINGAHGYLCERYVERPEFLTKVPEELEEVGVLLEPLTVVEKATRQAHAAQKRLLWRPRRAVVAGAGPIGLLAAALLRLRGLETTVAARSPAGSLGAMAARAIGAAYHCVTDAPVSVLHTGANIDLIVEATGAASIVPELWSILGRNGVLVLTGVFPPGEAVPVEMGRLALETVLEGKLLLGSVNANASYFRQGVEDMAVIEARWPGWLGSLITQRLPMERFAEAFDRRDRIKSVVEIG